MAKSKNPGNALSTASVLAFERRLDPSDALFSAGAWTTREQGQQWPAVQVREKSVRGTISNRLATKEQDAAKLDAAIEKPNLQTVDVATLPPGSDTLRVRFTLRILGDVGRPSACNNVDYQAKLKEVVDTYAHAPGFGELARRYACNLANGRFLWRNRMGAETVEVVVRRLEDGAATHTWTFSGLEFPLQEFPPKGQHPALDELAQLLQEALAGNPGHLLLEVVAYARIGEGQEIYPSQELILDRGSKKGSKSKTLYTVGTVAALHSQKVGNALRTLDTWYPCTDDFPGIGPISAEPYGSVTSLGKAFRQPRDKKDFYSLLDNWVLRDQQPEEGDQHYVIANLIRGGVYGEKEKD